MLKFKEVLQNNYIKQVCHILGACVKEGQRHYTGMEKAPDEFRKAGLINAIQTRGWKVKDKGNISTENLKSKLYGPGDMLKLVHDFTRSAALEKGFALTIGGDHSIATGTISGTKSVYPNLKVLWIDAHADCVIPDFAETKYRNYHGMPAAHLQGWISKKSAPNFDWLPRPVLQSTDICYIGIRDLDSDEKYYLKNFNIKYFTPDHIGRWGIGECMERALEYLQIDKNPLHISFDIDGVDPEFAPGTGTKCKEGLTYQESIYICRRAYATGNLVALDMVEVNPTLDPPENRSKLFGDNQALDGTETVMLGCELILAALGRRPMPFMNEEDTIQQKLKKIQQHEKLQI